jgi:predicted NBD/HSP70 family sugar kinase
MKSSTLLGSNINLVKTHNLQAILLSLLHDEKISRVELARQTSLSTTTITNLTAELLEDGIIVEEESTQSKGERRRVGRPRTMLRLVPDARYAVGVHIGIGLYRVAVANLHAEIIRNNIANFDLSDPPELVLQGISDMIRTTLAESGVDRNRVVGVGVGASGLVDYERGVNVFAPKLGWEEVPISSILNSRLDLPVCVDNNVRCMALGEAFFGAGKGVGVLAFVYGRVGVGAGLVVNGRVFRGSGTGAGEIGHTVMICENGEKCTCGNTGCLETLVSEPVLIKHALDFSRQHPESLLAQNLNERDDRHNLVNCIFSAACDGDEGAKQIVNKLSTYLGIALSNLVNVLNPELIILGGMFAQGCDLIVPVVEATMRETAFAGLGEKVRIQTTTFGWRAGVTGAVALALTSNFYQNSKDYNG